MKPVKPHGANFTYKRPSSRPDIGDLECIRVAPGHIESHWRLTDDELRFLQAGGLIKLDVLTEPIPPVALNVAEPECPECMVLMKLELKPGDADYTFQCPRCKRWAL